MLTITVPRVPPSGNELRRQYRHWAALKRLKLAWMDDVVYCSEIKDHLALRELCGKTKGVGYKIHLHIRIGRRKILDQDNAEAGLKPVLDALRAVGFIWDDSPKFLDRPPVEQFKSQKSVTEFTFSEVSENNERMRAIGRQFERIITDVDAGRKGAQRV